ncbi:hypothetical protein [Natrarchaeobius oligotrophus]|uniref:hypothetical protein n=1 Tax=Natrarchaeobius oligotrophus TaxID=3455743 RepID=UPI001FB3A590|nr:hypothetical protein [Natrarchaeobius chitinivorans]
MRVSVPGLPGVYYDTDSGTTAIATVLTAAGRRAPKPKGYAVQLLPYLWSFDVDLREVPTDHPIQYLHPEGARSLGELSAEPGTRRASTELESVLRFAWSVNREVESGANRLLGRSADHEGVVIEIDEGSVGVDGRELATDEFDVAEYPADDGIEEFEIEVEDREDDDHVADELESGDRDVGERKEIGDGETRVGGREDDEDDRGNDADDGRDFGADGER